jgi:hypothetical protein
VAKWRDPEPHGFVYWRIMMPTTDTPLYRRHTHRRASHWMGCAGAALCLAFATAVHAAPGGHGDGRGTQGPADSMPAPMPAPMPNATPGQTRACTPEAPADQALVGKSLGEAKAMLRGCPWRIGMQDGKAMPTTRDYRPDRRTLTIDNDKVTSVSRG